MAKRSGQGVKVKMKWKREILRLHFQCGFKNNEIAEMVNHSKSTVSKILNQAKSSGIDGFEIVEVFSDQELDLELEKHNKKTSKSKNIYRELPNWEYIKTEIKKKGVTLQLLYDEYKGQVNLPVSKTWFYTHYKKYINYEQARMTFEHKAGEKIFVDYSGLTFKIYKTHDEIDFEAEVFVGCLGFSDAIFCCLSRSQKVEDWCEAHVKCFEYFNGVPTMIVPDNLKSGVTKACKYDPVLNQTYHKLAQHYKVAVLPARVRKARDKAKAEKAVQTIQREIIAPLRNERFYSLAEAEKAVSEKLEVLNNRKLQKEDYSRWEKFNNVEKDCLRSLPDYPFEIFNWKTGKVGIDYHVEVEKKRYSVPYEHLHQHVEIRHNQRLVEVYFANKRIASHVKVHHPYKNYSTIHEHMPSHHKKYAEWNDARLINWAKECGPSMGIFAQKLLSSFTIPEQGYRQIIGVIGFVKSYPLESVEKACKWASSCGCLSYGKVKMWLEENSQKIPKKEKNKAVQHQNLRDKKEFLDSGINVSEG